MIIVHCDNPDCLEGDPDYTRQQPFGDRTPEERREFLEAIGWSEVPDMGDGRGPRHLCPFCHAQDSDSITPLLKLNAIFEGRKPPPE